MLLKEAKERHMIKYLPSFTIWEMEIKTTMIYHPRTQKQISREINCGIQTQWNTT